MSLPLHPAKEPLISEYALQASPGFGKNEAQVDVVAMRSRDLVSSFHAQQLYTFVFPFFQSSLPVKVFLRQKQIPLTA